MKFNDLNSRIENKFNIFESVKKNLDECNNSPVVEDTVKLADHKWVNKGNDGQHGKFKTKKEADAQRKAMFANGYTECCNENMLIEADTEICCICGEPINGYGNNAEPFCTGKCCDYCNTNVVIPYRMQMMDLQGLTNESLTEETFYDKLVKAKFEEDCDNCDEELIDEESIIDLTDECCNK